MGIGDWGLGMGDWGLPPLPIPQSPIPNPQSPIPNPQYNYLVIFFKKVIKKLEYKNLIIYIY